MTAIASPVLDISTSAASRPMRNCSAKTSDSLTGNRPPAADIQPASTAIQAMNANVSTGLLPRRSSRDPRNHRLLSPPRNAVELTSRILPSLIPPSAFRKATVKAVMPP